MKFKITKSQLDLMRSCFEENSSKLYQGVVEIELEPVIDTLSQAIYEQDLRNKFYGLGLKTGYRDGFYDGRYRERSPKYCVGHYCYECECNK